MEEEEKSPFATILGLPMENQKKKKKNSKNEN